MSVVRSLTAETRFGASHQLDEHPTCWRDHGHQYTVRLTWAGEPGQWGYPVDIERMDAALAVVNELSNRNLNNMLPASPPSVAGIAAYLLERTRMLGAIKVEVHESDTGLTGVAEHLDR